MGHIAPEAVDAGPIAFVHDGDQITLNVANKKLEILVSPEVLAERAVGFEPPEPKYTRGVLAKNRKLVGSASHGAVVG